jgi:hypothetical protein
MKDISIRPKEYDFIVHEAKRMGMTVEEVADSLISIGTYAYRVDGFEGSIHIEKNGEFSYNT